jgi:hypothetical protein
VLDDQRGRARFPQDASHGIPDLDDTGGVEVRRGLVEQQQPRTHRERAGEREPLLLPARELGGRMRERHGESDGLEGGRHAFPDLPARNPEVLAAECHVVADPCHDGLRLGVLQHQPGPAARRARRDPVDGQLAGVLALVVAAEYSRERVQQGRLARARRSEQQHPFPRFDDQVELAQRPGAPPGVPPAPAARPHRGGCDARGRAAIRRRRVLRVRRRSG